jgi:hypothetical protein
MGDRGPSPLASATDGAHPKSRCARSITGWHWGGSSCSAEFSVFELMMEMNMSASFLELSTASRSLSILSRLIRR